MCGKHSESFSAWKHIIWCNYSAWNESMFSTRMHLSYWWDGSAAGLVICTTTHLISQIIYVTNATCCRVHHELDFPCLLTLMPDGANLHLSTPSRSSSRQYFLSADASFNFKPSSSSSSSVSKIISASTVLSAVLSSSDWLVSFSCGQPCSYLCAAISASHTHKEIPISVYLYLYIFIYFTSACMCQCSNGSRWSMCMWLISRCAAIEASLHHLYCRRRRAAAGNSCVFSTYRGFEITHRNHFFFWAFCS